jgi:2,4-dienoyl-CoA reductase-like NADH-dependent reductase (Old Yellow Enzyme family)
MTDYNFLQSYTFKNGAVINNRIVFAPTTLRSSFEEGSISPIEEDYYKMRAGGPGLLISEVAYVIDSQKGFEGQIGAANENHLVSLKKLAVAMKSGGQKAVLQIFAAGSRSNTRILRGKPLLSASDIPTYKSDEIPQEMTEKEIQDTIQAFGDATRLAIEAGFDGVEIHGANLYLIQQFLSPATNHRKDNWGGDFNHRINFPLSVLSEVLITRHENPDFLVGYRLSPEEPFEDGLRIEETIEFAKILADSGIDYLHLSLQQFDQSPFKSPEITRPIVALFKAALPSDVPLITVGMVRRPKDAQAAIGIGADFVALGRQLIAEPNWVQKVENGEEEAIRYAMSKSDYELLKISPSLSSWLETRFKRGFVYVGDPGFNAQEPWKILRDEKGKLI